MAGRLLVPFAAQARLMAAALSKGFICRDCLLAGHYGFAGQGEGLSVPACPSCGGSRVVLHEELFSLTMAHIDCDAFYCSVEKRDNPALADKPVIVGGGDRGVVAAACYVARQYGIRSAMPSWQARKACPELVVIKPRMSHYQHVGRQIRQMMLSLTPLVQPLSIDEAFLDLTGTQKLHKKSPAEVLAAFQQRVRSEIGVSVSVGLAQNKSMAKIASDQDKPDGYYIIGQAEAKNWLQNRPVQILFGLGKVTTKKLNAAGLHKCGDIADCSSAQLRTLLGRDSERVKQLACGIDPRVVETSRAAKSISSETTFAQDMAALPDLLSIAETLAQSVSQRLKEQQMEAVNVTVKLKRPNHQLLTRTKRLNKPTQMPIACLRWHLSLLKKKQVLTKRGVCWESACLSVRRGLPVRSRLNQNRVFLIPPMKMMGKDRTGWKKLWTACAQSWEKNWSKPAAGSLSRHANTKNHPIHQIQDKYG